MPQPNIQYPTTLVPGSSTATVAQAKVTTGATLMKDYVFASGIHKPEHSNLLSFKYPQYTLTAFMERIGRYEPVSQSVWSWNEMDRTRKSAEVTAGGETAAATLTLTTDIAASGADLGYYLVGDVVVSSNGKQGKVTAIGIAGGFQTLTISPVDGVNFTVNDFLNNDRIGHAFNLFGEYSDAPNGRLYLPNERYNKTAILRRSFSISGSEFTNKTYIGNGSSWYFNQEDIEMKEFARDREIYTMFGQLGTESGEGVWTSVLGGGVVNTFASNVTEADVQAHITDLVISSPAKEYLVLAGAQFMSDMTVALKDYYLSGGVTYGAFKDQGVKTGLGLESYVFMGKTIHFVHYALFDDVEALPFSGTVSATNFNMSNASLWLDMGSDDSGKKLITMKYKELDGKQRKLIHAYETGMMSPEGTPGGHVSNGKDGFKVNYLSEIGVEVRLLNRHGVLVQTS